MFLSLHNLKERLFVFKWFRTKMPTSFVTFFVIPPHPLILTARRLKDQLYSTAVRVADVLSHLRIPLKSEKSETLIKMTKYKSGYPW